MITKGAKSDPHAGGRIKMQPLVIDAKPQPISIDPANAAVLVVDMQNDFGSKGGMFDRAGIDISRIQRAVDPTASVIAAARNLRVPIVYLKMGYYSDLSDLGTSDAPNLSDISRSLGSVRA
ncbi:isochorismatase family protein [Mesorhizobium sp. M0074]|uniref:hypothetical protein n=1 Tax=unclassified Mesorhizobium TaxID=325217 RepID=UPI00333BB3D5